MSREEVTTLEHPTLKVPYELLNKKFRIVQKVLDREISQVNHGVADLTGIASKPSPTTPEIMSAIDGVANKLTLLKRKAAEGVEEEMECGRLGKTRLDHLKVYTSPSDQLGGVQMAWKKIRCHRMMVDHFLREGHYATAITLSKTCDIEHLVDTGVFEVCQKVEDGLRNCVTGPCLAWCHDNRSKLRRLKSTLEYRIRLQDFTELVRQDRRMEAVKYARKYLSNGNEDMKQDLKSAMGLLAFSPQTSSKKYKRLFSLQRWQDLINQFRVENLTLYQLNSQSILSATLQAGLSALKTPQCYKTEEQNLQCPVCSELFNQLASVMPYSHSSQSYLICRISGEPMNEHNPPMALPNGYVYGEKALLKMSQANKGLVTCSRSGDTFDFSEVKKVFVM